MTPNNFRVKNGLTVSNGASITGNTTVATLAAGNTSITGFANVSTSVNSAALSVGTSFIANTSKVTIGTAVGLEANGGIGTAGQVLHSNGTSIYWAADDNAGGTVTSVATANGLSGGPITTTGTLGVTTGSTLTVNTTGIHVNSALSITSLTLAGAASGVTTLAAGNTTITGFANITGNVQISAINATSFGATLTSNTTTALLTIGNSSVSATMNNSTFSGTANNATNLGGSSLATVQGQITGNAATAYTNAISIAANATNLTSGTVAFARLPSLFVGTTTIQSTSAAQAVSGITTLAAGNTSITGFANVSTSVNSALLTVGTSFIANTTGAYHTGTVNAASHTTTGVTINATAIVPTSNSSGQTLGNSISRFVISANTIDATGAITGVNFTANSLGAYHTGTVNAASHTVDTSFIANSIGVTTTGFANIATTLAAGNTTITGDITVSGNLTINGTTTNINSTNLVVEDKNIVLADVATPTNVTADGGGITLKGATDKTFNWVNATNAWTSSEDLNLLTGKVYEIDGTTVLSGSALGTGITGSSLTSVGTLSSLTLGGAVSGITTLAAGNTSITGFANVTGNLQISTINATSWGATLTSNATTVLLTIGNSSVSSTINGSNFSGTANNASFLGGTAAASYQLNSTLSANVATLTANNSTNLGGSSLATVQGQITGNAATAYTNAIAIAANATNLTSGTVAFARLPSLFLGTTTIQSTSAAQAVSGITTLATGNTTITGFANVTSTIQGGSSLTIAGAASGITTLAAGNTTITGFANVSTSVNSALLTVGTSFIANTSRVVIGTAVGLEANGGIGTAGQVLHSNGTTAYWAADDDTNTTYDLLAVANTAVNAGLLRLKDSSNANDTVTFTGTGTSNVSSNATHIIINSTDNAATAYTNAIAIAANGSNITSGTVAFARLPSLFLGTTTIQSTSAPQAVSGITTLAAGNTSITGFANVSTSVNSALLTVGTSFIANTTGAYHTGTVNAASHTTTGVTINTTAIVPTSNSSGQNLGNSISRFVISANTIDTTGAINIAAGQVLKFNNDVGISRSQAAVLSIGNGTQNDSTGTISLTGGLFTGTVNAASHTVGTAFIANTSATTITDTGGVATSTRALLLQNGSWSLGVIPNTSAGSWNAQTAAGDTLIVVQGGTIGNSNLAIVPHSGGSGGFRMTTVANSTTFSITGNTSITGFANVSTSVNSALLTVGTSFIANTTGAYHTGTVNAAALTVGTSFVANTTQVTIAAGIELSANGGVGTAGQVLTSNGTSGSPYWSTVSSGTTYTFSTGLVNTSGTITVNSAYIATISANNASFLAGRTWETAGTIGSTTANTGAFTTLTTTSGGVANTVTATAGQVISYAGMNGGRTYYAYDLNTQPSLYEARFVNMASSTNKPSGMTTDGYWFGMGAGDTTTRGFSLMGTTSEGLWYRSHNGGSWTRTVDTSNIGSLTANNASFLGGTAAASYQLNSTLSANVATLNAATATALQTARTIGGVSFNGTANINLPGVNTAGNQNTSGTAASTPNPTFSADAVTKDNITTRTETGFYETATGTLAEGWPTDSGGYHHLISATHSNDGNYYALQIASRFDTQNLYFRNTNASGTTAWSTLLHSGNFNTYAPTLTGTGASGTWGINITGSAATATDSTKLPLAGGSMTGLIVGRTSASTDVNIANDTGSFSAMGNTTTIASMSFHRSAAFAINMGLGVDNVFRIGGWSASNNCLQINSGGTVTALADFRAPIFYDSNNTAYYADPNSTSRLFGILVGDQNAYVYGVSGNHLGIRSGAAGSEKYFRFDSNGYLYGGNGGFIAEAGDIRAPIFYDQNDTTVRWDGGTFVLRGTSPTVYFRDTDHNSAMIHVNSNIFYVLRAANDSESWTTVGSGSWPLEINLTNNNAQFGGILTAITDMRAPIFYDSNDTAYYTDPNGDNRLRNLNLGGGSGFDASLHIIGIQGGNGRLTQMSPNAASQAGLNIIASRTAANADQWWSWGPTVANVWCINSGTSLGTGGIQITSAGALTAADNITAYSDIKLKKNIELIPNALEKVLSVRGVTFERIDTGNRGAGVIAQEIEKILPEVVMEDEHGIKSVAYGNMVGLLIEAIKEQQTHINRLEEKINSIQNNRG